MPQHELPTFGQRGECIGCRAALKVDGGNIEELDMAVEFGFVIGGTDALSGTNAVDM